MASKRLPGAGDGGDGRAESKSASVTMTEVATRAGVSIATVSRVLSGQASVAPEYRARVMDAVRDLSYRPNRLARNLRRQNAEMIGVVISDIENPHFAEMVHVAEDDAYRQGYRVLLCNTDENSDKQASYLRVLADERPVGVIVAPCDSTGPEIGELLDLGIPIVAFDRTVADPRADAVLADNTDAAEMAVAHLAGRGRAAIAYLGISPAVETGARRLGGYRSAMAKRDLEPRWVDAGLRVQSGRAATEKLLVDWPETDAIVVGNNMVALGALQALQSSGRSIPHDVAVVAFDDPPWAPLVRPSLTTLAQPVRAMTSTAVRLLLDRISGRRSEPERVVFQFTLRVRESS